MDSGKELHLFFRAYPKNRKKELTAKSKLFLFLFSARKKDYFWITVPAFPLSASTALSSEVMIARRPGLLPANLTAA